MKTAVKLKGIIVSVSRTEGMELEHTFTFKITDNLGSDMIQKTDVISVHGFISPFLAREGMPLLLTGEYSENVLKFIKARIDYESETGTGLLCYLTSGAIPEINKHVAVCIIRHFGKDALHILDESPDRINELTDISEPAMNRIVESWKDCRCNADAVIEAMSIGLSSLTAHKAVEHFGLQASDRLSDNPYLLSYITGYGYLRADRFAKARGMREDSEERIQAAMWYCLNGATSEGHTFLPVNELARRVSMLTGIASDLVSKNTPPHEVIITDNKNAYASDLYEAERSVARLIRKMAYKRTNWSISGKEISKILDDGPSISSEQRDAVIEILTGPCLSAILGPPGTGKTTLIKTLMSVIKDMKLQCVLTAPTGKAANRITEQTGHSAMTIHRLLGRKDTGSDHLDCLIVDEASFIDIILMRRILEYLPSGAALVLVGDTDQLPSVGPGNVLKEISEKGLCNIVKLNFIYRQGARSQIVRLAHAINEGVVPWDVFGNGECQFIEEQDAGKARMRVLEIITGKNEYKPHDIQVLTPMKRGVIGSLQFNNDLKIKMRKYNLDLLKSKGFSTKGYCDDIYLQPGDRVIQRTNNYRKCVFNGEIGYVVGFDESGMLMVDFDRAGNIRYRVHELYQLDYAYALTVHKAQGSEYPCVVMPVHTTHYMMLFRSLLYTAVTRARERVILIGTMKAITIAAKNNRPELRYADLST